MKFKTLTPTEEEAVEMAINLNLSAVGCIDAMIECIQRLDYELNSMSLEKDSAVEELDSMRERISELEAEFDKKGGPQ